MFFLNKNISNIIKMQELKKWEFKIKGWVYEKL